MAAEDGIVVAHTRLSRAVNAVIVSRWLFFRFSTMEKNGRRRPRSRPLRSWKTTISWNDLNDIRMHGRDERHEIHDFYTTVEFTYRLMKELGGGH